MRLLSAVKARFFILLLTAAFLSAPSPVHADAAISGPIAGKPVLALGQFDFAAQGYVVEEFFLSGTATSYKPQGAFKEDGRWQVAPDANAPFTTRIVVVRPVDPAKFNGSVLVEWLNVSAGTDGGPDWSMPHRELMRSGFAYVGVSVQKVGVEGGPSLALGAQPIKKADPTRYGALTHPGDAFAMDIFSQVGRLVREGGSNKILGPLKPQRVLGAGESQSAVFLTTYVNAVDPVAKVYDGYLIHSRFSGAAPLEGRFLGGPPSAYMPPVAKLREDLRVPTLVVLTETDVLRFVPARQPDSARLRIWEVAGTAHADIYLLAVADIDSGFADIKTLAKAYTPTSNIFGAKLNKPVNGAPQHHYVLNAAVASLDRWVKDGKEPAHGAVIAATAPIDANTPATITRDANGNAQGGIRSPWMDVPTAVLSGAGNSGGPIAFLVGSTEPFDQAKLKALYPGGKKAYLKKFEKSLKSSIAAGFILPADKSEIMGLAAEMYPEQ